MRFQVFLAVAFALATPIYGRALSDNAKRPSSDLLQKDIWSTDVSLNEVLPRRIMIAKKAKAPMALGRSKIGKGKSDPRAPIRLRKSSAWFKKNPGGDKVIIEGTTIPIDTKFRRPVSTKTVASNIKLKPIRRESIVWLPVWVAIYQGSGAFKHWALFVENEPDTSKSFIVHATGRPGSFRYEQKLHDAHTSPKLHNIIQIGHVDSKRTRELRAIARDVEIKSTDPTWNCQDFVWQLIHDLAAEEILDENDEIYTKGREEAFAQMEGVI